MKRIFVYIRSKTPEAIELDRVRVELYLGHAGLKTEGFFVDKQCYSSKSPELFKLLNFCHTGDILLITEISKLTKVNKNDWLLFKSEVQRKSVNIVSLDVPASISHFDSSNTEINIALAAILNSMLLDVVSSFIQSNYEHNALAQQEGIQRAREAGKYKGSKPDVARYNLINEMLANHSSWQDIMEAVGCCRDTISKARKYARNNSE